MDLLDFLNNRAQYLYSLASMHGPKSDLLDFTEDSGSHSKEEKLKHCEMALEALAGVIKHNRGKRL